jgi:hypothetical protein
MIVFNARVTNDGPQPFAVHIDRTDTGECVEADAILTGTGGLTVALSLDPSTVPGGPGGTAIVTVMLNNLGAQRARMCSCKRRRMSKRNWIAAVRHIRAITERQFST